MHATQKFTSQRGLSLVSALFLLVVLASLAAVAVRISSVQQQTVVLAMQSSRAYAAARAGVEWVAYQALVSGTCVTATLPLTEAGLNGFAVDTACTSSAHTEGSGTSTVYRIEAFARSGVYGTPDYVSRRIHATITDAT